MEKEYLEDIGKILEILPHRYPFLLVDRIVSYDKENKEIHAQKSVTINEPFFQGHFPSIPVMPGVLIIESLAQAGGILAHFENFVEGKIAVLIGINEVRFSKAVRPGDRLDLLCKALHLSHRGGKVSCKALSDGKKVCEAQISFAFVNREQL